MSARAKRYAASEKGKETNRVRAIRWRATPKGKRQVRSDNLKKVGWTVERWIAFNYAQGGLCYLCGMNDRMRGINRELSADHDHETGEPRGLLCTSCNTSIHIFDKVNHVVLSDYLGE